MALPKTGLLRQLSRIPQDWVVWGLPTIAIPGLRYFQDPPDSRNKLFLRDFSTYFIGCAVYFMVKKPIARHLAGRVLHQNPSVNEKLKKLLPVATGVLANVTYAGLGAVKVSTWLDDKLKSRHPARAFTSVQPQRIQRPSISTGGAYAIFRR